MIVHRVALQCFVFCLLAVLSPVETHAHGGVVQENDLCVIKVNYLSAHFKIYQPRASGHEQFCEDLPAASESVFVMEYQHDSLSIMPIDFRIIRDVTGKGRFARREDVEAIGDLAEVTVHYQPAIIEPDVYSVVHEFEEEGDFIGIVSARHLETNKVYTAVFPFEVGFTGFGYWPFFIGLLVLIQLQYLLMSGRSKRRPANGGATTAAVVACLLLLPIVSLADEFVVTYTASDDEPSINRMHSWVLHVETTSGTAVEGAVIEVAGRMPAHDHGLPTSPRVTADLGGGDYQLDGLRFHMGGHWEIIVTITTDDGTSFVTIPLEL